MNKKNLNILLIEDESILALEFTAYIEACGYNVVDYVTNSKDALSVMDNNDINLIIMDINIGEEIDGIDLYTKMNTNAYVIYVTAYRDSATIEKAIATEPLGYITKPMNDPELRALLQLADLKVGKKVSLTPQRVKLSEHYCFDIKEEKLYKDSVFLKLSAKKRALIKLLIEADGQAVSFESIESEIYKDQTPSESTIRTLIYRLRNDLDEELILNELNFGIKLKKDSSPDTCGT